MHRLTNDALFSILNHTSQEDKYKLYQALCSDKRYRMFFKEYYPTYRIDKIDELDNINEYHFVIVEDIKYLKNLSKDIKLNFKEFMTKGFIKNQFYTLEEFMGLYNTFNVHAVVSFNISRMTQGSCGFPTL